MDQNSQIKKGVLEGCVLKILESQFHYSGEIIQIMQECGFTDFSEGTLYPMLMRLEKENCFETKRVASTNGPSKKYYKLSYIGIAKLIYFNNSWKDTVDSVDKIFMFKDKEEKEREKE